jgi:hypothetical protein
MHRFRLHGGPGKALLLLASEVIDALCAEGWPLFYGALGENLTTRAAWITELGKLGNAFVSAAFCWNSPRPANRAERSILTVAASKNGSACIRATAAFTRRC